jgi:tetratricopeptide (TPR) repeat protein
LREVSPEDQEVVDLYNVAYLGYYLGEGRRATFEDRDEEALEWFEKAANVSGDSHYVEAWRTKTEQKLTDSWLSLGNVQYTAQNYNAAAAAYKEALKYTPGLPLAITGLEQVTRVMNYRAGLGDGYYKQGVHSLSEYQLREARREFRATTKYLPENSRARDRTRTADELLAEQRVEVARALESDGLYTAAHREFLSVLKLDGNNADAKLGRDRLAKESEALALLRKARLNIYRRRFDEALVQLDKGSALTNAQAEVFEAARTTIRNELLEESYHGALGLERDGKYPEAIKAFGELFDGPGFYKDARARMNTLSGYIEMAEGYYERAMSAEEDEAKLEHLRSIEAFWPDYRNVGTLIEGLER